MYFINAKPKGWKTINIKDPDLGRSLPTFQDLRVDYQCCFYHFRHTAATLGVCVRYEWRARMELCQDPGDVVVSFFGVDVCQGYCLSLSL